MCLWGEGEGVGRRIGSPNPSPTTWETTGLRSKPGEGGGAEDDVVRAVGVARRSWVTLWLPHPALRAPFFRKREKGIRDGGQVGF